MSKRDSFLNSVRPIGYHGQIPVGRCASETGLKFTIRFCFFIVFFYSGNDCLCLRLFFFSNLPEPQNNGLRASSCAFYTFGTDWLYFIIVYSFEDQFFENFQENRKRLWKSLVCVSDGLLGSYKRSNSTTVIISFERARRSENYFIGNISIIY